MRTRRLVLSVVAATALALMLASTTLGAPSQRTVQIRDNCDPVSFNELLGPGSCIRDAGMTVDTFIKQLLKGGAQSWRFAPEQLKLSSGGTIKAINRGGELHTFTEVAAFGGGCVSELNGPLGLSPVAECAGAPGIFFATGVAPGSTRTTEPLSSGVHYFQCLIHPWQRTTVTVD